MTRFRRSTVECLLEQARRYAYRGVRTNSASQSRMTSAVGAVSALLSGEMRADALRLLQRCPSITRVPDVVCAIALAVHGLERQHLFTTHELGMRTELQRLLERSDLDRLLTSRKGSVPVRGDALDELQTRLDVIDGKIDRLLRDLVAKIGEERVREEWDNDARSHGVPRAYWWEYPSAMTNGLSTHPA